MRESLHLWVPKFDDEKDMRVEAQARLVKFLLGHRGCCLLGNYTAGSCNGRRFDDAGRFSNFQNGASFEHAATTLTSLDSAFYALNYRLRRAALCLIKRGSKHLASDGKFGPGIAAIITWGQLARFYNVRKQTLMDDAREAVDAMALIMLDWVKVELPT